MRVRFRSTQVMAPLGAVAVCLSLFLTLRGWATEALPLERPISDEILSHVRYLASDELMGRGVDTPGIELARDYIEQEFKKYGLVAGGTDGSFFQALEVVTGVRIKEPSLLRIAEGPPLILNDEWGALGFSRSASVDGDLVFVGYGITAKGYGYDDYAEVDVKGKVVLVLRHEPPPKNEKSPFQKGPRYSNHATFRAKAANARNHGAVGMILVDLNPRRDREKELLPIRRTLAQSDIGLVAVQVKHEMVERHLQERGISLQGLKEKIDREEKPASIPIPGLRVSLQVSLEKMNTKTHNVIGVFAGSDPQLKEENIVIGAHYDHIGLGYFGTRDRSTEGKIHNGADDNASGTVVLLDIARKLSRGSQSLPRTIIFVAFTAEELGARGSRHYVNHPPFPIASTKAMINLDMVGRMRENRVTAAGIDTAKEFRSLVATAAQESGIETRLSSNVGSSDHAPFYNKGIPVLHFHTGSHEDYHRPTDRWEKLNIEGMIKISDLVSRTLEKIARLREPLSFVRIPSPEARSKQPSAVGVETRP